MARLVIISGPPGAGKTTVGQAVADALPLSASIHGDQFWHFLRSGYIPPWLDETDAQNSIVMGAVAAAATAYCAGGYDVILDGIVFPRELVRFHEHAAKSRTELHYVVLRPDRQLALARAVTREMGELVDPDLIADLYGHFSHLGEHERFVVDSSELSVSAAAQAVLERIADGRSQFTFGPNSA